MKKVLIILTFFSAVIFTACEHVVDRTYILKNDTDHNIKIKLYNHDYPSNTVSQTNTIALEGRGDYWEKAYHEDMATSVNAHRVLQADSLVVTYDDARIQYYEISAMGDLTADENPLYNEAYQIDDDVYLFTFTEEDYNKAEEIGG